MNTSFIAVLVLLVCSLVFASVASITVDESYPHHWRYRPHVYHRPINRLEEALAELEAALEELPEDWRLYGNIGKPGRGGKTEWNAGFEYTSKSDEVESEEEEDEEYDPEDFSLNGRVGSGGNWQLGGTVRHGGVSLGGNVGPRGQWEAQAGYTRNLGGGTLNLGGNIGPRGQWGASAGYTKDFGRGSLNLNGNIGPRGNYGLGATYKLKF